MKAEPQMTPWEFKNQPFKIFFGGYRVTPNSFGEQRRSPNEFGVTRWEDGKPNEFSVASYL